MGAQARRIWAVIKSFWWVIVLVIVAVLFGWLYLTRRRQSGGDVSVSSVKPTIVERVADRVRDAATDVQVETAVIKAESDVRRKELEEVRAEPDGKKRRERLVGILRKSL